VSRLVEFQLLCEALQQFLCFLVGQKEVYHFLFLALYPQEVQNGTLDRASTHNDNTALHIAFFGNADAFVAFILTQN